MKQCIVCKKELIRKEFKCGRKEDVAKFNNRKFCSLKCFGISRIGTKRPDSEKKKISETMKKHKRTKEHIANNKAAVPRGKRHWNWKGGKGKDRDYIMILSHGHPFADYYGYVREHRLIMEKHLGRYLSPEEIVHHINGVKSDNRIENLKLFNSTGEHSSHHNGVRRSQSSEASPAN
jgi:hypothetical protein